MAIKLTTESFLTGIRQSGLVDLERLDAALHELRSSEVDLSTADAIADALVERELITRWQATKLLLGKFKGFLLGRYRLQDLLGRGEMSSVYLAEHVMMKRRCAVKVLPAHRVKDTSYLGRFHREAEAVAALDHPNIVRAYDVGQETEAGTEIHFLVMEYIEGKNLEKRLAEQGEYQLVEAVEYIRQGAEGLAHAHENGVVHRDIKPGNLLIDTKGTVKLLDLGLARFFKVTDEESLTIMHDEKVLGTADYLAPEQAVDSHAVDERADIYSLGCTMYFALTGQPPFTDGTLVQRLLAHQTKAPQPVQRLREDVPDSLAAIIARMMQKQPEDRYQSAAEVAEALSAWLIEHADHEWKQQHPEIVARLQGIEAVLPQVVAPVMTTTEAVAVAARDDVQETELPDIVTEFVDDAAEIDAPEINVAPTITEDSDVVTPPEPPIIEVKPSRRSKRGRGSKRRQKKQQHAEQIVDTAAAAVVSTPLAEADEVTTHVSEDLPTLGQSLVQRALILPGWHMAGFPINAKTGLIAATLLAGMMLVFGFGYHMLANESVDLTVPNYQGEFNLPGPNDDPNQDDIR